MEIIMKNAKYFFLLAFSLSVSIARQPKVANLPDQTPAQRDPLNLQIAPLHINNMVYWIHKSSLGYNSGSLNGVQADFPKGTGGAIYEDGLVWGGLVNDGNDQTLRVGGSTYFSGIKAGIVRYDDNGNVIGSTDPVDHHIWWIRRDFETADLTEEAALIHQTDTPSNEDIQNIYDTYEFNWNNWPVDWGAPFEDIDGDGAYDPDIDIPGVPGSDQTIWVVANDVPEVVDENGNQYDYLDTAPNLYGSNPIGIEVQISLWSYDSGEDTPLNNTIFKNVNLKYTGLVGTPNDAAIDSFYISQWSDPDLGVFTDDFVGVDVDRSLGFAYNGQFRDDVFNGVYNMPTPAVGYDVLLSPTGEGEDALSSFSYFGAGSEINDPDLSSYSGTLQFYNLMRGFQPRPEYPFGIPWYNNDTGEPTVFPLSGDPVFGYGDLDGVMLDPGDRRLVMSSGPLSLSIGDEMEMVIALSGAVGENHLHSIHKLKKGNRKIQAVYNSEFHINDYAITLDEPLDGQRNVQIVVETDGIPTGMTCTISDYEGTNVVNESLFDDGAHDDGESGDGIFGNTFELPISPGKYTVGLLLNTPNDAIMIGTLGKVTTDGPVYASGYQIVYDNLNDDGQANPGEYVYINFEFSNDGAFSHTGLSASAMFSFDVEHQDDYYLDIPDLDPMTTESMEFNLNDSRSYTAIKIREDTQPGDSLDITFLIRDELGNTWKSNQTILVEPFEETPSDMIYMDHVQGAGGGEFGYRLIFPSQITSDSYELTIQNYDWSTGRDVSPSTISGIGYRILTESFLTLEFLIDIISPDYNYADGVKLIFPEGTNIVGAHEANDDIVTMVSENEVMFGDSSQSTSGFFTGGQIVQVFVDTLTQIPIDINYVIYDDGWAQYWCMDNCEACESYNIGVDCDGNFLTEVQNAEGDLTISEIGEYEHTEGTRLINVTNLTTGELVLEGHPLPTANGINMPIFDGFKIFKGSASYFAPPTFSNFYDWGYGYYDIGSYYDYGWSETAMAVDTYGAGTTDGNLLSRDIEIRFTGVYGEPQTDGNGVIYIPVESGGSMCWIDGARLYDLGSQHPDPNNPGTGEPFQLRIPFEVWDIEASDGPQQIDITIYDRRQNMNPGDTVYAFNPYDRMYTHFIHMPHEESQNYGTMNVDMLTWNLVWWDTDWVYEDTLEFEYNIAVSSDDVYQFTPSDYLSIDKDKLFPVHYELSQNFPNPFNPITEIKYALPEKGMVELVVYDVLGREVKKLVHSAMHPGNHIARWNGKNQLGQDVGTGMYFYRLKTKDFVKTRKMILLK